LSKIEVDAVEPQSGTSLTLGASGDTITIPAGATFDSSAATTTLPATVVTTTGTQTLSNKTIDATQLTDSTVTLAKLSATGTKDATTFLRGDNTFASAGGANTPAFYAYQNSNQTISNATWTKSVIDTEVFDVGSCYDNVTNYRFTPNVAGKYMLVAQTAIDGSTDTQHLTSIYFNGTAYTKSIYYFWSTPIVSAIITFNGTTDYAEVYCRQESGSSRDTEEADKQIYFFGYKIIE
jgi:hypothetical protein